MHTLKVIYWRIPQYPGEVHAGDRALLWRAPTGSGGLDRPPGRPGRAGRPVSFGRRLLAVADALHIHGIADIDLAALKGTGRLALEENPQRLLSDSTTGLRPAGAALWSV